MPMFYTPKPRQFRYVPRFYDPEKEEWEKLKTKYRIENGLPIDDNKMREADTVDNADVDTDELEYFQKKIRDIDRKDREKKSKLTLNDLFRKREKPQFHYVSRFDSEGNLKDPSTIKSADSVTNKRIHRRFEEDDMDRFKPIPAGKIITYTLIVFLLLIFIFG